MTKTKGNLKKKVANSAKAGILTTNASNEAFLVKMRCDYAPYDIVIFAKTDKGAIGKAKRKFPSYEILSANFIRHCL